MVTQKDLDRARQDKEVAEEAALQKSGPTQLSLGPSDSSDSTNDLTGVAPDTDSDRNSTGERPQVENTGDEPLQNDIEPDKIILKERAGLAHTPPDPVRNGGVKE